MAEYQVGALYHPLKTRWQDGSDFNYLSGCLELRLFFSNLTASDIRQIQQGACTFHLAIVEETLFFLFQFGKACPLSENSYSWWLVDEKERTIPLFTLNPGERAVLTIILVSAEDGIIRAIRQVFLSHGFSSRLFEAIRKQTEQPFNHDEHNRHIAEAYRRYPTPQALLEQAQISCFIGGREGRN
jgi:hypothetical protein